MMRASLKILLMTIVLTGAAPGGLSVAGSEEAIAMVLDDWHAAAAAADEDRYFAHFAPDAIFLGTDASERWTVPEFLAYAHPHFAAGRGWTYAPHDRHVLLSADETLAWIDEGLTSKKYGELRGTGVLRSVDGEWKLVHYSMTFTIPNAKAQAVVSLIQDDKLED